MSILKDNWNDEGHQGKSKKQLRGYNIMYILGFIALLIELFVLWLNK